MTSRWRVQLSALAVAVLHEAGAACGADVWDRVGDCRWFAMETLPCPARMLGDVQRRWLELATIGLGVAALAVALALALWPLHTDGLRGTAIAPRYSRYVGFYSYEPLPAQPTKADFRRAGITLPRDQVANRRRDAGSLAALGILVTGIGVTLHRHAGRRRQQL